MDDIPLFAFVLYRRVLFFPLGFFVCLHRRMSTLGSSEFSRYAYSLQRYWGSVAHTAPRSIHLSLSWLSAVLYMLEIILAAHYLSHFDTKRPLKALLFIMLLADTICMTTIFASTWLVCGRELKISVRSSDLFSKLIIKGPQSECHGPIAVRDICCAGYFTESIDL